VPANVWRIIIRIFVVIKPHRELLVLYVNRLEADSREGNKYVRIVDMVLIQQIFHAKSIAVKFCPQLPRYLHEFPTVRLAEPPTLL
jgi:hypothetical protein